LGWGSSWTLASLLITLGIPAAGVFLDAIASPSPLSHSRLDVSVPFETWFRTAAWAAAIALSATLLGLPLAFAARPLGSRWAIALLLPLFFPMYLAYAGWGMVRAPASSTGAWLAARTAEGRPWLPSTVDAALALLGLSVWAAPLAAMLLLPALRRLDDDLLESLRLDARKPRRLLESLRLISPGILLSLLGVAAVMLGSALPLHLAKIDTAAVSLWARLDLLPHSEHWRVWAAAWPLALAAIAAAWLAVRAAHAAATDAGLLQPRLRSSGVQLPALLVLALGILVPAALYARVLADPAALLVFWRVHGSALAWSLAIAASVALLAAGQVIALAHWLSTNSTLARAAAALFVAGGLVPGVLFGAAVSRAWATLPALDDLAQGPTVVLAMHLARVGPVIALAAIWLACSEPAPLRDARRIDDAESVTGWAMGRLTGHLGIVALAALAAAAMSLHDIESSVMVQPAGVPSLPRKILNDLHFFRSQEIAAAVLTLLAVSASLLFLCFRSTPPARDAASRPETSTIKE
jgi:ABC-type spermidine/putrescine transport system permease subunit II